MELSVLTRPLPPLREGRVVTRGWSLVLTAPRLPHLPTRHQPRVRTRRKWGTRRNPVAPTSPCSVGGCDSGGSHFHFLASKPPKCVAHCLISFVRLVSCGLCSTLPPLHSKDEVRCQQQHVMLTLLCDFTNHVIASLQLRLHSSSHRRVDARLSKVGDGDGMGGVESGRHMRGCRCD